MAKIIISCNVIRALELNATENAQVRTMANKITKAFGKKAKKVKDPLAEAKQSLLKNTYEGEYVKYTFEENDAVLEIDDKVLYTAIKLVRAYAIVWTKVIGFAADLYGSAAAKKAIALQQELKAMLDSKQE